MKKSIRSIVKNVALALTLIAGMGGVSTVNAQEKVLFWHSMSGNNGERLQELVDDFNATQDKYEVEAVNQGSYDESTATFFNMGNSEGRPALLQIGEQNLQSIYDSGLAMPLDGLFDEFGFSKDDIFEGTLNFYTIDDELYAMPFNASSPILFYNAEALEKAGITEAPETFEDILAMQETISENNDGMKVFGMHPYGYAFEQMATNIGGFVVNNDNGRSELATEVAYQPEMKRIFGFFEELVSNEQFGYYGSNFEDVLTAFNNGEIAMFIHTSAQARNIIDSSDKEVGVAYLPVFEDTERLGVYAAGGAIVAANNLSDTEKAGAMAFLEYATSPEAQAKFAGGTGYFPINTKSYETDTWATIKDEYTQIQIAADQFLETKQTPQTAGPLLSVLPQLRTDLNTAAETVFSGGFAEEAVDNAAAMTNGHIETANASVE